MKCEWRKNEKDLYGTKITPRVVEVSKRNYIMISGKGNPNDIEFSEKVSALYSLAYAIKMGYKSKMKGVNDSETINDYAVYPLEGVWQEKKSVKLNKNELEYNIMIHQPDFVTKDMVDEAMERIKKKKPNEFYKKIIFDSMKDGKCLEILHIGSYDDEPASFKKMDDFMRQNEFNRCERWHREIYLNNENRTSKSKLKTILRYAIK